MMTSSTSLSVGGTNTLKTTLFVISTYVLLVQLPIFVNWHLLLMRNHQEHYYEHFDFFTATISSRSTTTFVNSTYNPRRDDGSNHPYYSVSPLSVSSPKHDQQQEHQEQNVLVWNTTREFVRPDNDNTAIVIIAMGGASKSWIAERCIWSIRHGGNFTGPILLLTDGEGYGRYHNRSLLIQSSGDDSRTFIIQGRPNDFDPVTDGGQKIKYLNQAMIYKRFKTLTWTYLELAADSSGVLDSFNIRYILYLDVDNIVTKPLSRFFDDYYSKVKEDYQIVLQNLTEDDNDPHLPYPFSFVSMWRDPGDFQFWQSGQIMLDRQHSLGCEDAWRNEMDTNQTHGMDQPLLMNVVNNFPTYRCRVFELPRRGSHEHYFDLLRPKHIKKGRYPTILHITSARFQWFDSKTHQTFVQKILQLDNSSDNNSSSSNNNDTYHQQHRFMSVDERHCYYRQMTMPISAAGRTIDDSNDEKEDK